MTTHAKKLAAMELIHGLARRICANLDYSDLNAPKELIAFMIDDFNNDGAESIKLAIRIMNGADYSDLEAPPEIVTYFSEETNAHRIVTVKLLKLMHEGEDYSYLNAPESLIDAVTQIFKATSRGGLVNGGSC